MSYAKSSTETKPVLRTSGLSHSRLRAVVPDITLNAGEAMLLLGDSGVGKSTVLCMLAGWLAPRGGRVDGPAASKIGVVAQQAHLLKPLSALENLLAVQSLRGMPCSQAQGLTILERLGVADMANQRPAELSRGQQQRVALARALLGEPELLLADEPTANLDDTQCALMLALMLELSRERGMAMIIATHDARVKFLIANHIVLGRQA